MKNENQSAFDFDAQPDFPEEVHIHRQANETSQMAAKKIQADQTKVKGTIAKVLMKCWEAGEYGATRWDVAKSMNTITSNQTTYWKTLLNWDAVKVVEKRKDKRTRHMNEVLQITELGIGLLKEARRKGFV